MYGAGQLRLGARWEITLGTLLSLDPSHRPAAHNPQRGPLECPQRGREYRGAVRGIQPVDYRPGPGEPDAPAGLRSRYSVGFPPRPGTDSQGLATWTWFMQRAKVRAQNIDGPPSNTTSRQATRCRGPDPQ